VGKSGFPGDFVFRGVTNVTLDAKGRLAIPTRYRPRLNEQGGGKLIVTVDAGHILLLYPFPEWTLVEQKLNALPTTNPRARQLQRLLVGHATEVEMDGAGRVLLPPALREFAALDKQVALIGQGNKFELWDGARFEETREKWLKTDGEDSPLIAELESLSY
jgi:MraZ protein